MKSMCSFPPWKPSLLLALLAFGWHGDLAAQEIHLRMRAQTGSSPKYILDGDKASGICPEIIQALSKEDPNLHFDFADPRPLPHMENELKTGNLDAACALAATDARQATMVQLRRPLYQLRVRMAVRADDNWAPVTLAELADGGKLICTMRAASYVEDLRKAHVSVDDSSSDPLACLRLVQAGRVRGFYFTDISIAHTLRSNQLENNFRLLPTEFSSEPSFFWMGKHLSSETVGRVDKALAELEKKGTLKRIYEKYTVH